MADQNEQTSTEQQQDSAQHEQPRGDQQQQVQQDSGAEQRAATRPDGLADEYWDAEKNEVKFGDLIGKFGETQAKLEELQSRFATVPEKPAGYAATAEAVKALLPQDLKLPADFQLLPDDHPVMAGGKKLAHDLGIPAAEFPKLVAFEVQRQVAEQTELATAAAAERTKLGEKAPARIEAVENFLRGRIGDEAASALFPMLFTAKQVEAFETLIRGFGSGASPSFTPQGRETNNKPDFSNLKGAERIHAVRMHAQGRG